MLRYYELLQSGVSGPDLPGRVRASALSPGAARVPYRFARGSDLSADARRARLRVDGPGADEQFEFDLGQPAHADLEDWIWSGTCNLRSRPGPTAPTQAFLGYSQRHNSAPAEAGQ